MTGSVEREHLSQVCAQDVWTEREAGNRRAPDGALLQGTRRRALLVKLPEPQRSHAELTPHLDGSPAMRVGREVRARAGHSANLGLHDVAFKRNGAGDRYQLFMELNRHNCELTDLQLRSVQLGERDTVVGSLSANAL